MESITKVVDGWKFGLSADTVEAAKDALVSCSDLAERLGYGRPTELRRLIENHEQKLNGLGHLAVTALSVPCGNGTRNVEEYLLNRKQALYLIAKSGTPTANDLTVQFIDAFDALLEQYATQQPASLAHQALAMAQALVDQEKRLAAQEARQMNHESRVAQLEAHQQPDPEFYTVLAWAKILGTKLTLLEASALGREAADESKRDGYQTGKARDPRFGTVGLYHTDILTRVFQARKQGATKS